MNTREFKIDRPLTAPELSEANRIPAKTSKSFPDSLMKYRKNNTHKLLALNKKNERDKVNKENTLTPEKKENLITENNKIALTRTHIIEESKEVLSWIPTTEDKQHVVLHYRSKKSPLFDTMDLVRGQLASKNFNPKDFGYKTELFIHRDNLPNTTDKKNVNYETKDSIAYLKGAKVIIPVCYGVQKPIDGQSIANIANGYIVHHGVAEVIVYLGRYSDPEFKFPANQLDTAGKQKRDEWLTNNQKALTPKNLQIKDDFLHKVKIVHRHDWIQDSRYKQADAIFKFFLDAKIKNNDLLLTIEKDVATYSNRMKEKNTAKVSPVMEPLPNKSSSTRLMQDAFTLTPSAFPEIPPLPPETLAKVCELKDHEVPGYIDKLARANAIHAFQFVKHFRIQLANECQAFNGYTGRTDASIYHTRTDLPPNHARAETSTSPTCGAEALKKVGMKSSSFT